MKSDELRAQAPIKEQYRANPVGFTSIRLRFDLDTDAPEEQIAKLLSLTERYCVVYQTLRSSPQISLSRSSVTH